MICIHKYQLCFRLNKSRYDERLQLDIRYRSQRNRHEQIKREFCDDPIRDKERSKHKEDFYKRAYYERKGRELEEAKRFSNSHRM